MEIADEAPGHLFIIDGDLTKLACDAVLIPTDAGFTIEKKWDSIVDRSEVPNSWGGEYVLHLRRHPNQPWVWLGNVGVAGQHSDFAPFAPRVREFVAKAGAALKDNQEAKRIYPWPKPRLAVNVIGSGEGGGRQTKGDLLKGLVSQLEGLARESGVDIVLVAYGAKAYAAAQRARRQLLEGRWLQDSWSFSAISRARLVDEAERIAVAALDSQLVLFIGAGVSAGAGLPTWSELLSEAAEESGIEGDLLALLAKKDPRDQAAILDRRLRETTSNFKVRIADKLSKRSRYSLQHGLLASLPSKEAVTTNFDTLFESAATTGGRRLAVLPEHPQTTGGHWLLKLHGTVGNPSNLVITRSDYLDMPRQYGALMGLVQGLLLMRHMVFVGYSLKDEDFHELIHEVRAARGAHARSPQERGTVLTLFHDELERELWADDLHVVPMVLEPRETASLGEAARQLDIFLDLVGYLATTSAAFFLDATYRSLSEDEADLRERLIEISEATRESKEGSVGYQVKRFLEDLGADS